MEKSATKRMAKNFSWMAVGSTVSGLANFAVVTYIARVLHASTFGLLYFAMAFLSYLTLIVDSGLAMLGTREIAREKESAGKISLNIYLIRISMAFVVYAVSAVFIFSIPISFQVRILFLSVFLILFHRALNIEWVFQGLEKMEYSAAARMVYSLSVLLLVILLVKGPENVIRVPLIQFFTGAVVASFLIYFFYKYLHPFNLNAIDLKVCKTYFTQAMPLAASNLMILVYTNLDTIMLGFMKTQALVGYYNAAYQVFLVFVGFYAIWQSTAVPVISRKIKKNQEEARGFVNKYLKLTALAAIPAAVFVFLLAPLIITLIFGAEYAPSILALRILIWTLISIIVGSTYSIITLIPAGRYREFFTAALCGAMLNIILNFLLIPAYGIAGAAIATILSEVFSASISCYYAGKVLKIDLVQNVRSPVMISLFSGLAFMLGYYLSPFYKPMAGGLAYIIICGTLVLMFEKKFIFAFAKEVLSR